MAKKWHWKKSPNGWWWFALRFAFVWTCMHAYMLSLLLLHNCATCELEAVVVSYSCSVGKKTFFQGIKKACCTKNMHVHITYMNWLPMLNLLNHTIVLNVSFLQHLPSHRKQLQNMLKMIHTLPSWHGIWNSVATASYKLQLLRFSTLLWNSTIIFSMRLMGIVQPDGHWYYDGYGSSTVQLPGGGDIISSIFWSCFESHISVPR